MKDLEGLIELRIDSYHLYLDYYGPEVPTIVIFGQIDGPFKLLHDLIRWMASHPDEPAISLESLSFMKFLAPIDFDVVCKTRPNGHHAEFWGLRQNNRPRRSFMDFVMRNAPVQPALPHFTLTEPPEAWENFGYLMKGMEGTTPGHQYLTNYPSDDATLIISRGESNYIDYWEQQI